MEILKFILKSLFILATVIIMAAPFLLEIFTYKRDKENKISYKRFRVLIFTVIYVIGVTIALFFVKKLLDSIAALSFVQWIINKVAISHRLLYSGRVFAVMIVNLGIGALFVFLSKFVRIGLKKKNLVIPKKKNGQFNWRQKVERKVIRFFHTETWFFVGSILKYLSITLSVVYALVFVLHQVPIVFGASWVPYKFILMLFEAGYIYPTITLLALWEAYFFLGGIKRLVDECPELLKDGEAEIKKAKVDLEAIDAEVKKQFADFYACDVDLSAALQEEIASASHHEITRFIAEAVENDKRNPERSKEVYLNCLDKIIESDKSVIVNGSFFSEFSMYFLRYLSTVVARGDNVVFVCNNEGQINEVYNYVKEGLSELSSLYCKGFKDGAVDFDDPIFRVIKIEGENDVIDEASVDDNSILVTSLSYLCSSDFEGQHGTFIHLLDTIVFVDALKTVNTYNRQLAMLNTRLKHITKNNALLSKNGTINEDFRVRYMSKQVRYICFDDTRTPGLDKVLKNLLAVEFESADSMHFNPETIVRCYNYEGKAGENGRRACPQFFDSEEEIGAIMNMAVLCLAKGASNVTVFADDAFPYANIEETIAANMGKVVIQTDEKVIRLNSAFYNPDNYSVLIVMDSGNNLPAAIRKYLSMVSDKPSLIIVFSKSYMLRDYYLDNINELWSNAQMERIPVEESTKKDIAQRILVKANAGGITEEEILRLAGSVPSLEKYVQNRDISAILRAVLEIYAPSLGDDGDLFRVFEYSSSQDFDENGIYSSESRVLLRRQGKLFELINGRNMVIMSTSDSEIVLPMPRSRMTQNYIAGQNLLYNGNIYHINRLDTESGKMYTRLAVGGMNDEAYSYLQAREYCVELDPEKTEPVFPTKHVVLKKEEEDVSITDAYVSVFRAPMEVLTHGYYEIDPHTLSGNEGNNIYHCIDDPENIALAKQTYRRYGAVTAPTYSPYAVMESSDLVAKKNGALMMSIRLNGQFGSDVDKTMTLAATMLNELLHSMFPSVADSVVVCPVLHNPTSDKEADIVMRSQPRITVVGEQREREASEFELVIIEDCETDLGVVSVLMSAGNDILNTLFNPILNYLTWYLNSDTKSSYLYYGLDHEPSCFDFEALHKLSKLVGDDKHDLKFVDLDSVIEYAVCDFCGKRYAKGDDVIELDDGRTMCKVCASSLVGNNKKILKAHLERARIFLENTYGIVLDGDYDFCFESTVKIVNTLKQNHTLVKRGSDAPLRSYIDGKKKVHVECTLPSINLSELLVRELTHVWQIKHLPEINEELAEGHIALVAIQYLRFLNQDSLADTRTNYYESTANASGVGYRRLVKALLQNPQFDNNPFRYLLEATGGGSGEDSFVPPTPRVIGAGDYGAPYVPDSFDRALNGDLSYFYYSRLSPDHQSAYNVLLNAIAKHEESVVVPDCDLDDLKIVGEAIEYDHPELFWYKSLALRGSEALIRYGATVDEAASLQRRIDEVIPKYLEGIDDSMSAYDVALRLHVKLISSVDYDTIALERQRQDGGPPDDRIDYLRTICGVFLDGKSVCEGYARALQYLLQKCGIESAEVAGFIHKDGGEKGGAHAWNIVKIDGDYYYMDTTWDDGSNTIQKVKSTDLGFDYFCITADELSRTRDLTLCPTDVPICDAIRANYYFHNGLLLDVYDLNRIKGIAQAAAKNKSSFFTFKCSSKAVYDDARSRLFVDGDDWKDAIKAASKVDKRIDADSCNFLHNDDIWTITVKFKYK